MLTCDWSSDVCSSDLLVVTEKSEKVYHYAKNVMHEVGIIAHSCGLDDPRELDQIGRASCRERGYVPAAEMTLAQRRGRYPQTQVMSLPALAKEATGPM